jgi:hypothetical protein
MLTLFGALALSFVMLTHVERFARHAPVAL